MSELNDQQRQALKAPGDALVQACPGSGKTRVLAAKMLRDVARLPEGRRRFLAGLTYTIRAAEEITRRFADAGVRDARLWVGTIHSFCREWVLHPYRCYSPPLRRSFRVASEGTIREILDRLKAGHDLDPWIEIPTRLGLNGEPLEALGLDRDIHRDIIYNYHQELKAAGLVDHDQCLYYTYKLLKKLPCACKNLARLFEGIYLDEYQDTSEVQYSILGLILGSGSTRIFVVGDPDQAIYRSLGGVVKTAPELESIFCREEIAPLELSGNYRSSSRIVDFCTNFRVSNLNVVAMGDGRDTRGCISFDRLTYGRHNVADRIASLIQGHVGNGVAPEEICVLAPKWRVLLPVAREVAALLPDIPVNVPGAAIFKESDGVWHRVIALHFGEPNARNIRWRRGEAALLLRELSDEFSLDVVSTSARACIRVIREIRPHDTGIAYLKELLTTFLSQFVKLEAGGPLAESINAYLATIAGRLGWLETEMDFEFFRSSFTRTGVQVTSCHAVKGLEFEVVICFGLLKGHCPAWASVIHSDDEGWDDSIRLLYVVASRAKRSLHLISEFGFRTKRGGNYEVTPTLERIRFRYDADQL
ncbi:MAG: UvrD-helicase domain-containing protein [Vulcanimicrobiota bacterium]